MSVAMLDLTRQYEAIRSEVRQRLDAVVESQSFILGSTVEELEQAVADYLGVRHAVGVASGTDALLLPLRALDLRPGDEVITTPFTFFATAGAIHNAGGRAVFVDIEPDTFNLDVSRVESAITPRTRAIVPVHLFGQMASLEPLRELADLRGLFLLEDAAQAIGARQRIGGEWRSTGQVGDAAALSFFPSKNLGGFGDGGMVVTDDDAMATRLRRLRVHGGLKMYHHDEVGFNSRLDALQAAVLLAKLPFLNAWSAARRSNAAWYDARLAPLEARGLLRRPAVRPENESVYNQYTIATRARDELREFLAGKGLGSAVYYPVPLHLQPCFAYLGYAPGDFPESERASREVLSIPVFPELTEAEREAVAASLERFFAA
jgi:dTDP-4-amino-4,6-dideoxygalactose transaminase